MEIFKFEKNDITHYLEYELKVFNRVKEPINYIIKRLVEAGNYKALTDDDMSLTGMSEDEGKSYNWSVATYKNITLLIRRYNTHFTIYYKIETDKKEFMSEDKKINRGAFVFHLDYDKVPKGKSDEMHGKHWDAPFTTLNESIKNIFDLLIERGGGWFWNSVCIKRPDYVEMKDIYNGNTISSLDLFTYCLEEIDTMYCCMFAQHTMLNKLKDFENKIGEMFDTRNSIDYVNSEITNKYYYNLGIGLIDTTNDNKKTFVDVYNLTNYYFKNVFKEKIFAYKGDIYTEDANGVLEPGIIVGYKDHNDDFDSVTIFTETCRPEAFIPLKKL